MDGGDPSTPPWASRSERARDGSSSTTCHSDVRRAAAPRCNRGVRMDSRHCCSTRSRTAHAPPHRKQSTRRVRVAYVKSFAKAKDAARRAAEDERVRLAESEAVRRHVQEQGAVVGRLWHRVKDLSGRGRQGWRRVWKPLARDCRAARRSGHTHSACARSRTASAAQSHGVALGLLVAALMSV